MSKYCWFFLVFCFSSVAWAQEEVPFAIRFQDYLKGDLTFIANNIVNRNSGNNTNEPYNKTSSAAKLNDEFEMQYIDIDTDTSTFSSSSAVYNRSISDHTIVFAGLYWAATYKNEVGVSNADFVSERVSNFNEILIKTPGSTKYQPIKGQVIFDGFEKENHKTNAPYLCFSDITGLVKNNPYGQYTVANVKATQGFIEGGVAGGWVLYFVYKDENLPPKYVTLYDGFAYVYNKPVAIEFNDFLTPKTGVINGKIALAALEGDLNIKGDNVRIKNPNNNKNLLLDSKTREGQNLFNSQISRDGQNFIDREPASLNTLGFDALLENITNKDNEIFANNATKTELKISSIGDKFYLLTVGFTIDVEESFYLLNSKNLKQVVVNNQTKEEKVKEEKVNITTITPANNSKNKETQNKETQNKETQSKETVFEDSKNATFEIKPIYSESKKRKDKDIRKIIIPTNLKKGFYLVVNVFAVTQNAINYSVFLKQNNLRSGYFTNPENNYRYIFLKYYTDKQEALQAYYSNYNNTFFDDYWLLEVDK